MKAVKVELKFEVYGPKGFEEKVFKEAKLFVGDSPKFNKRLFLKMIAWIRKCARTYNAGLRLTPAQIDFVGKEKADRLKSIKRRIKETPEWGEETKAIERLTEEGHQRRRDREE